MHFINNAEMASFASEGFAKKEITTVDTVTTIYSGKPGITDPSDSTDDLDTWTIMRTVIVEDGAKTTLVNTWAKGSWTNRESLTYKYL